MTLQTIWFIIIAVFWVGFWVLEGFDFGVGALHMLIGRTETERRVAINTIGPFWDGNEVWLVVAAGATFAAFPDWYATAFSANYLILFAVLVGLILRAVGSEFRDARSGASWRTGWDVGVALCCLLVPFALGTVLGGFLNGLPINQQ